MVLCGSFVSFILAKTTDFLVGLKMVLEKDNYPDLDNDVAGNLRLFLLLGPIINLLCLFL
jgi:hypothetical protein